MITFILITNDPVLAAEAHTAGVTRIMVDLESHGKRERQASRVTFISSHLPEDIPIIRKAVPTADLIVRINPWHAGSSREIDLAIAAGANRIMLPMITDMAQFDAWIAALDGRAQPLPLVETRYSMDHMADIVSYPSVSEVYIGLNDLHLSLGLDFLFEPLAMGLVDRMADHIKAAGKSFGFGGLGAIGGNSSLPAERVLGEHLRLGSSCVILSSRFAKDIELDVPAGRSERLRAALGKLHEAFTQLSLRSAAQQQTDALQTANMIRTLSQGIKQKRNSA